MTPQQKEIQILIGDLNRETQVLNNFLDAAIDVGLRAVAEQALRSAAR